MCIALFAPHCMYVRLHACIMHVCVCVCSLACRHLRLYLCVHLQSWPFTCACICIRCGSTQLSSYSAMRVQILLSLACTFSNQSMGAVDCLEQATRKVARNLMFCNSLEFSFGLAGWVLSPRTSQFGACKCVHMALKTNPWTRAYCTHPAIHTSTCPE